MLILCVLCCEFGVLGCGLLFGYGVCVLVMGGLMLWVVGEWCLGLYVIGGFFGVVLVFVVIVGLGLIVLVCLCGLVWLSDLGVCYVLVGL